MKYIALLRISAASLMIGGIFVGAPIYYYQNQLTHALGTQPSNSSVIASPVVTHAPNAVTGKPVSIQLPSVHISLPVTDGSYNPQTGDWTLSKDHAQFALPSVQPNNIQGDTFVYGHALTNIFGNLYKLRPGDKAIITTDNGYNFTYTFTSTQLFSPEDTSVFNYKGIPRLTVQTCSGSYSQHRQMYYFSYDGYTKI